MAVIRVKKTKDYTVMSNKHLRDINLSLKAKGLLSVIFSLPDNWDYSIAGLVAICKESENAVKSAMKELKDNGYLMIHKERGENGRFEYTYTFLESPEVVKPRVEKPEAKNVGQLNTKELSTDKLNTDKSKTDKIKESVPDSADRFEEFWESYPKQIHRCLTEQAYAKQIMNGVKEEWLIESAKEYALCVQELEKKYVKNPENWLKENLYMDYPQGTYEKKKKDGDKKKGKENGTKERIPSEDEINARYTNSYGENWNKGEIVAYPFQDY